MWILLLFTLASAQSLEQVHRLRHQGCSEHDCIGTTTCMVRCISYLQGDPCDVSTSDIELYMDMYYLKKINVRTTCWESFVTYYIDVVGESDGMTKEEYNRKTQDSLRRVDIVDGKWYGYGDKPDITHCRSSMNVDTFDYVFPLWDPNDPALKRTLRSFEKNGLLDFVRNVYVIVSKEHAVEDLLNTFSGLQIVRVNDIHTPFNLSHVHEKMIKHFAAPYIDGIADNYMMGPDDTILNSNFKKDFIFDFHKGLFYFHSFGSDLIGHCMGFRNIAPNHGPNVLNKCAMQFIIQSKHNVHPAVDPVCVYAGTLDKNNMLAGVYGYHDHRFRKIAGVDYFSECHTNGGCRRPKFDDLFVNIQGNGISVEYGGDDNLHRIFSEWFDQQFPTPSRFERTTNLCKKTKLGAVHMIEDDGFLPTGDIDDMWIRDSAAQVHPLLDMPEMLPKIRKVIEKQAFFIEFDPYANSYGRSFRDPSILGRHGWVTTRNYELDSGAYFFRLVYEYWKRTGTTLGHNAILKLLDVWRLEQTHGNSRYKYDELLNGVGTPVGYTGMSWTGFRPSDDKCTYHYHIPDNVFAAVTLGYLQEMGYDTATLRQDILQGIHKYGVKDGMYCYEVDGLGGCNMMDDANVPSLLSLPYLDPKGLVYNKDIYEKTREFILSPKNPYYYSGTYKGIGSPHTPKNHVWHLSLIMQAILGDKVAHETLVETASESGPKASVFHESFHVDNPAEFTRKWFGWADALYYEMCT